MPLIELRANNPAAEVGGINPALAREAKLLAPGGSGKPGGS